MKKLLMGSVALVLFFVLVFGGLIAWSYVADLKIDAASAEKEKESMRSELMKLRAEHYKVAEYDSVYSRMDHMISRGFLPDTLTLWAVRRAWNELGLADSTGMSWSEIESSAGKYDENWLGEKGVFMLSENFLRDITLRMGADTTGFVFRDYHHPYMQAKWAAFTELAIRIKLGGKGSYWAYNTGALMFGRRDFDILMDEFVKWRAKIKLNNKPKKR